MEHTVYVVLAVGGSTLLVVQVVLQLFGLAGDVDTDTHLADHAGDGHHGDAGHGSSWFFGILSFKALVAFAGVFGLTGLALEGVDMPVWLRIVCAAEAGLVAMVLIAFLMRSLHSLSSSGTLDVRNAVGREGAVYLRLPPAGQGRGKVTLEIQGRSVELAALTEGDAIATGARVRVVEVVGEDTVKVVPLS